MQKILDSHNVVHVATLDSEGIPCVGSVNFAASGKENVVYFFTSRVTRKVEQIRRNHMISFAIDKNIVGLEELSRSCYIKGTAVG